MVGQKPEPMLFKDVLVQNETGEHALKNLFGSVCHTDRYPIFLTLDLLNRRLGVDCLAYAHRLEKLNIGGAENHARVVNR